MADEAERRVRISRVAGRYLIFDIDDVVYIRRSHGICAVLTGTMPQNPTQNLFLGLPVEIHAEDARLLVEKGVGYVADELTEHLSRLSSLDESTRGAYLQHIKQQRRNAQQVFEEEKAKVQALHKDKRKPKRPAPPAEASPSGEAEAAADPADSLFDAPPTPRMEKDKPAPKPTPLPSVTPTTSVPLLPASSPTAADLPSTNPATLPLLRYLNARGYYTTPGLRFGGDLSVYPGDPFRYHAHYLANGYGWDEQVAMLDLVTSGRLGTAVKKGFLFGAEKPRAEEEGGEGEGEVRVFCIEWAGM